MTKYKTEKGSTIWVIPYAVDENEAIKMGNTKFKIKADRLEAVEAWEYKDMLYLTKPATKARKVWAVSRKGDMPNE